MICRISFIYGLLWEHENLTPLTHDTLHEFFGYVTAEVSKQLALTMRENKLVSASGEDIYLPDVDKEDRLRSSAYREHINRLNMPISFIVGKRPWLGIPQYWKLHPVGNSHIKNGCASHKFCEVPLRVTKILFCGFSVKFVLPLGGINSKTTHYFLPFLSVPRKVLCG